MVSAREDRLSHGLKRARQLMRNEVSAVSRTMATRFPSFLYALDARDQAEAAGVDKRQTPSKPQDVREQDNAEDSVSVPADGTIDKRSPRRACIPVAITASAE